MRLLDLLIVVIFCLVELSVTALASTAEDGIVGRERDDNPHQTPLGSGLESVKAKGPYTVTLDFDDLPTDPKTGIGFTWNETSDAAVAYRNIFVQAATLVNVDVAKLDPWDITCATSGSNALFLSRRAHAWPRFSLHNLSAADGHTDLPPKSTFDLVSLTMSPIGLVRPNRIATFHISMFAMPPTKGGPKIPTTFPGVVQGVPALSDAVNFVILQILWGPGRHTSQKITLREWFPRLSRLGVTVMEIYGDTLKFDRDTATYVSTGEDVPFCLDDLILEVDTHDTDDDADVEAEPQTATKSEVGPEKRMTTKRLLFRAGDDGGSGSGSSVPEILPDDDDFRLEPWMMESGTRSDL